MNIKQSFIYLIYNLQLSLVIDDFLRETETSELFDENGFVFMGDLGYFDENGTLFYRYSYLSYAIR